MYLYLYPHERFCSHRLRDGEQRPHQRMQRGCGHRARWADRQPRISPYPPLSQLLPALEHRHTRPYTCRHRPRATFPRGVGRDRADGGGADARGAQQSLRRGVHARRIPTLRHGVSRLPFPLHLPRLTPPLRARTAQPPASHRSGSMRFRPPASPPRLGRRRGVRRHRHENTLNRCGSDGKKNKNGNNRRRM